MAILTITTFKNFYDHDRIRQLATESGSYVESIVTAQIAAVEGDIYSRLSKCYTVTQIDADAGMALLCAQLVIYHLESRRGPVSADTKTQWQLAEERLKQLTEGEAKLADVEQVLPRISPEDPTDHFENSGYFDGYTPLDE